MLTMFRVPRVMAVVLFSLTLAATALIPLGGVASAQVPSYDFDLVISAPESVLTGQVFTVRVEVIEDDLIVTTGCASSVRVTLRAVGPGPTWDTTVGAKRGIARFSVTLGSPDSWNLTADVPAGACDGDWQRDTHILTAVTIPASQPVAPCPPGVTCEQVWNGGDSAATLIAATGSFFDVSWEPHTGSDCDLQPLETNGILQFDYSGDSPKKVIFTLGAPLVDKGIGRFEVCWDGAWLPACKKDETGPCVLFKRSGRHNIGYFEILAPPGDPRVYVH